MLFLAPWLLIIQLNYTLYFFRVQSVLRVLWNRCLEYRVRNSAKHREVLCFPVNSTSAILRLSQYSPISWYAWRISLGTLWNITFIITSCFLTLVLSISNQSMFCFWVKFRADCHYKAKNIIFCQHGAYSPVMYWSEKVQVTAVLMKTDVAYIFQLIKILFLLDSFLVLNGFTFRKPSQKCVWYIVYNIYLFYFRFWCCRLN